MLSVSSLGSIPCHTVSPSRLFRIFQGPGQPPAKVACCGAILQNQNLDHGTDRNLGQLGQVTLLPDHAQQCSILAAIKQPSRAHYMSPANVSVMPTQLHSSSIHPILRLHSLRLVPYFFHSVIASTRPCPNTQTSPITPNASSPAVSGRDSIPSNLPFPAILCTKRYASCRRQRLNNPKICFLFIRVRYCSARTHTRGQKRPRRSKRPETNTGQVCQSYAMARPAGGSLASDGCAPPRTKEKSSQHASP
jgi:hypothetical protein